jgi:integrase
MFLDEWSLQSAFIGQANNLRKLTVFLNEKYPTLYSLLDLDIEKAGREWMFWLNENGVKTQKTANHPLYGDFTNKTSITNFLKMIHSSLFEMTDTREEWEKDRWNVRVLYREYGIGFNNSTTQYYVDFTKIERCNIRDQMKKYIKQRLLSKNNFSWSTARNYLKFLPKFINFIFLIEPLWEDFRELKRHHIEQYILWLNQYTKKNIQKNAHPESYISENLKCTQKFIEDIQRFEYEIAPEKHARLLFFPEDKPKRRKKSIDQIDFIPDYVLEQLFSNINSLQKEIQPVLWIAFKTGLRISDVLGLTQDCLVRLNNNYYVETDIEKTYVIGHRIPIDDELAKTLGVLISHSKANSNKDNNPDKYIFVRYRGARKGMPFSQGWIGSQLNKLAIEKNIADENGKVFHFRTHQFRHTYAVKMLNGGADILTVQELLAHDSQK